MSISYLEFIETRVFSKARKVLLEDDDEFHELQCYLLDHHDLGDTIRDTGGGKKIRWSRSGMGKQGGTRIIYYTRLLSGRIYLLLIYPKNVKDDLNEDEKATLKVFTRQINL